MSNFVRTRAINAWNTRMFSCWSCRERTESQVTGYVISEANNWVEFHVECPCGGQGRVLQGFESLNFLGAS